MNNALNHFKLEGTPVSCDIYGSGHINRTELVTTDAGRRYILQQINNSIFTDVDALMANIVAVTGYLARQDADPRHVLTLVPTLDGKSYYRDDQDR